MPLGIFWLFLVLMAAVGVNQLLFSSEENGIVREKGRREEILQRMKALQFCLKKEIADLEARQEALTRPALKLEKKIQQYMCKILCLAAIVLLKLWG